MLSEGGVRRGRGLFPGGGYLLLSLFHSLEPASCKP